MSIESFHSAYPAGPNFYNEIAGRSDSTGKSPVAIMADIYRAEGARGLSELRPEIAKAFQSSDSKAIVRVSEPLFRNAAAIYMGTAIRSIEAIISDHEFDQEVFQARIDYSFTGTGWDPARFLNPEVETVSDADVFRVIKVATKDKTFADFFMEGSIVLPRSLQTYLKATKTTKYAKAMLLDEYSKRTRLLIQNGKPSILRKPSAQV